MKYLIALFARLSLPLNHAIGAWLGRLVTWFSPRYRRHLQSNLARYFEVAAIPTSERAELVTAARSEAGKSFTELAIAWMTPLEGVAGLVKVCTGWEHVEAAKAADKPIIFATPHLGCYDIAGRYLSSRLPITALYRPPKLKWLEPIMEAGRSRGGAVTAAANAGGVRALLRTLKSGGNIMVLPDQVPAAQQGGEGVWANFYDRPAFTMTLLPRLAQSTGATVLFFFAERLPSGAGYRVHFEPMTERYSAEKATAARQTNAMVEKLIAMAPAQYLWGYNRYKHPAGAPLPPSG